MCAGGDAEEAAERRVTLERECVTQTEVASSESLSGIKFETEMPSSV